MRKEAPWDGFVTSIFTDYDGIAAFQAFVDFCFYALLFPVALWLVFCPFLLMIEREIKIVFYLFGRVYKAWNTRHIGFPEGMTVDDALDILNCTRFKIQEYIKHGVIRTFSKDDILYLVTEDIEKLQPPPYNPKYTIEDHLEFGE
tara:strand:+ start:99 stop:533 length:435 start_codon:yes stop_codon:yes gene_type:complete